MADDLYTSDVLAWSESQADLIRRFARGERVNDIDWDHVAEEIEDVGQSQLNAVESYLRQMLVHLLKLQGWPGNRSVEHWRDEVATFQADAAQRFTPSMRQRISVARIYDRARRQLADSNYDELAPRRWAETCPFELDQLLTERRAVLETTLAAQSGDSP